ncbi:ABC transporter permease [Kallotenue papyrolyticum]|uniref:ABC transporter permease n=1 Tax=Kallotenue papyrolyticum TaxID=1325125 RepID=UPI0004786318|nr:ABC transporter permease [Kallotenue papyrolyticum]
MSTTETQASAEPQAGARRPFGGWQRRWTRLLGWETLLVGLIISVALINARLSPFFLRADNLLRTTSDFIEIGIMLLPMVFVIITGNIDLSVASILGLSASLLGWLHLQGVNIWLAAGAALLVGALAGLLNGLLVARLRLPALVVTLGTFSFYRGLAYALLGDQAARGYPRAFTALGQGRLGDSGVPVALVLFAALALIFTLVLHGTVFGRYLYAIGNNEAASRFSGVPTERVKIIVFTLSGLLSALAGLVLAARFGSTRPDIGTGLELTVITVTVLGGISIFGGSGSMLGALLALVLFGSLRFGMGLVNIQGQVQGMVIGTLLILSILAPRLGRALPGLRALPPRTLLSGALGLAVLLLFIWFFFWSRALILNG